jgi:hypothetical protein
VDDDKSSVERLALGRDYDLWVQTAHEAIEILKSGNVRLISLDHDLGDEALVGSGYDVAKWIEEKAYTGELPGLQWKCHSANPVGREKILMALRNADRYWLG